MNKKSIEFTTTQLLLLLLAVILILFMIAWYTGLKDYMIDIINNLFD